MSPDESNEREFEFQISSPISHPADPKVVNDGRVNERSDLLDLSKIREDTQLSPYKASYLMAACVWCMRKCRHTVGVSMKVQDDSGVSHYAVHWRDNEIDQEELDRSLNEDDAIEHGAEALALLLSIRKTGFTAVQRAVRPNGFDYFLGHKGEAPNLPFNRAWRLEISGILRETGTNSVNGRIKQKLQQISPSDGSLPGCVIVIEFSKPFSRMVKKNELP